MKTIVLFLILFSSPFLMMADVCADNYNQSVNGILSDYHSNMDTCGQRSLYKAKCEIEAEAMFGSALDDAASTLDSCIAST